MLAFYKKAVALGASAIAFSLVLIWLCLLLSQRSLTLLPADNSRLDWQAQISDDQVGGGASQVKVYESRAAIDYEFELKKGLEYPFVTFSLHFAETPGNPMGLQDFSPYSSLTFNVKCNQPNTLSFSAYTFEEGGTRLQDGKTYRPANVYYKCDRQLSKVKINLQSLVVPDWWLAFNKKPLADTQYNLAKTVSLVFGNSPQSPLDTRLRVTIDNLELQGRKLWVFYLGAAGLILQWLLFLYWYFRQHTQALVSDLKKQLHKDLPLVAYQQLVVEPHKDKEKSALLHFIATQYANPELSVENAVTSLGLNRNKINELLKQEIGMTFSSYLNKIRLTEAARLLSKKPEFTISEAAFAVGYNNVSYFNKLFKAEYGCTPKIFQDAAQTLDP